MVKNLKARLYLELSVLIPSDYMLSQMIKYNRILLNRNEIEMIRKTVKHKAPCNLLIWGLGNDSVFWTKVNRGGTTLFLEDNKIWFQKVNKKRKRLKAFLVDYNTQRTQWRELLESEDLLVIDLPKLVKETKWDIVIVDGPAGYSDTDSGRMKSIYLTSKLADEHCDVFVHDCDRQIEDIYCNRFLKKKNLKTEIDRLRHYRLIYNESFH